MLIDSSAVEGKRPEDKKTESPKKDGDKKEAKKLPKVSAGGLDFTIISSKINGQNWELLLEVVSPEKNGDVQILAGKGYTEEGKTYSAEFRPLSKNRIQAKLPLEQKVQVKVNMGPLPEKVTKLTTVELTCSSVRKPNYTVTFKDVAVER
jgi:hypothetical protein